jgi:hypothetical protein
MSVPTPTARLSPQARRWLLIACSLASLSCEPPMEANHRLVLLGDITVPATVPRGAAVAITLRVLGACGPFLAPTVQRAPGAATIAFWVRNVQSDTFGPCPVESPPLRTVVLQPLPGEFVVWVRIRQPEGPDFVRFVSVGADAR